MMRSITREDFQAETARLAAEFAGQMWNELVETGADAMLALRSIYRSTGAWSRFSYRFATA